MLENHSLPDTIIEHCAQSLDNALLAERYPLWQRNCPELSDIDFVYLGLLRCMSHGFLIKT